MPRTKRPLADADANTPDQPAAKKASTGDSDGQENQTPDYSKKTIPELSNILKERSLPHSGKKAVLIERLEEADRDTSPTNTSDNATETQSPDSFDLEFETLCKDRNELDRESIDPADEDENPNECGDGSCMCHKPLSEYPDWKFVISKEGGKQVKHLKMEAAYRDQDYMDEYHYNDFSAYGFQEVVENHLLAIDKELSKMSPNLNKLWPLLEGFAHFLPGDVWWMSDDSDGILHTIRIIGALWFLPSNASKDWISSVLTPPSKIYPSSLVSSSPSNPTGRVAEANPTGHGPILS